MKHFYLPFRVYDETASSMGMVNLAILVFALAYTVINIKRLYDQRLKYFKSITNVLDLTQLVCCYAGIAFYTMRLVQTSEAVQVVVNSKGTPTKNENKPTALRIFCVCHHLAIVSEIGIVIKILSVTCD